jgi:hypothetical protein
MICAGSKLGENNKGVGHCKTLGSILSTTGKKKKKRIIGMSHQRPAIIVFLRTSPCLQV